MEKKSFLNETKAKMEKSLELLREELATIQVGRASPSLVEKVTVETYGTKMKILELALISTPEPNQILIKAYDPGNIEKISRAISEANLGFSPAVDGEFIRITIPPLTAERREEMVKLISQRLEGSRITVRQIRQEAMQNIDQAFEDKEFSEDDKFRLRDKVQEIVDQFNKKIEELGQAKEKEMTQL